MLRLLVSEPAKFDQLPRTLGALQDMQVFWIGEIQLLGRVHPRFQGGVVDTANALRISQNGVVRRERRWSTAGANPVRELDRSTR